MFGAVAAAVGGLAAGTAVQFVAARAGAASIGAAQVEEARRRRSYLAGQFPERIREAVQRGELLLDVSGSAVGQVNSIAVLEHGDDAFGRPSRITATVGPGREGVVDIEREVELSGPIHSKGVQILNGYLVHRFGGAVPLSLTARLVFEQDSISNVAHQLGFFETIASWRFLSSMSERIQGVTLDDVARVAAARLTPANRVVGRFDPLPEIP